MLDQIFKKISQNCKSNMLIGYLFNNRLLIFTEDSTFLLLNSYAAICEEFWLTKNIRPKISALTVQPRNKKSEFSPLCSLLSEIKPHPTSWQCPLINYLGDTIRVAPDSTGFWRVQQWGQKYSPLNGSDTSYLKQNKIISNL